MRRALLAGALAGTLLACEKKPEPAPTPPAPAPAPAPPSPPPPPRYTPLAIPKIDVHTHIEPGALPRALKVLGAQGIVHVINLSGGGAGAGLEETLAEAAKEGHATIFCNPDFREMKKGPGYGARIAAKIQQAKKLGARGIKISKGLGLGYVNHKGELVPVDDPGLDPLFATAGKLGMPIAIHTGDPKAFWLPPTPENERFDELRAHPGWSFHRAPVTWQQLYDQFERRVARHPKTLFIGVHFGNDPEDPANVARMLDKYPNLYIDTAARVPEIGRIDKNHDAARLRAFFEKYQDRIFFGTDSGIGLADEDLMFGSTGAEPPTVADMVRFFDSTWRWFETPEKNLISPTAIQGRWTIDGIALPKEILEKVYHKNAEKLLGIKSP